MEAGSAPGRRRRSQVPDPLNLSTASREATCDSAEASTTWGVDLVEEDERSRLQDGRDIPFGRWASQRDPRAATASIASGLASVRLARDALNPMSGGGHFAQVSAVARAASIDRRSVFERMGPRALVIPNLAHAHHVIAGDDRPWPCLTYYHHDGWGGPEANAYGLHRITSEKTLSRLAGFASLSSDCVVPFSCLPYCTGTQSDPAYDGSDERLLEEAAVELELFGVQQVPSTHIEQLALPLRIAATSRDILIDAAKRGRSVACGRLRVSPVDVLRVALPPWVTFGALPSGVQSGPVPAASRRDMPGCDGDLLRAVCAHGLQPICLLLDTAEPEASQRAAENVIFNSGGDLYSGTQLMQLAWSPRRGELPGLVSESPESLRELADRADLAQFGVTLDDPDVDWLWHPDGLRLLEGRRDGLALGLVLRATAIRSLVYVVRADLSSPRVRGRVMACCELHSCTDTDPARGRCIQRVAEDYELHTPKPRSFATRTWLRHGALLANSALVSVGRSHQASLLS